MPDAQQPFSVTPPVNDKRSYSLREYISLPRNAETWLLRPLIPTGGNAIIYGDAKVGKSYAAIQLAVALTGGIPDWLGFSVNSIGPVLYVQLDTPRSLWMSRLDDIIAGGFDLSGIHFADREPDSLDAFPFDIVNPVHYQRLRAEVTRIAPVAVIIDTIREAHSGEENVSDSMQAVVARLESVVRPATLILISHARKAQMESGPDLIGDMRGSNYVVGRMDAIIRFTKKYMIYTGRAVEEGSVKLRRLECGLWLPEMAEVDAHIAAILADSTLTSVTARAKALSARTGKGEEACRSLLRRYQPPPSVA